MQNLKTKRKRSIKKATSTAGNNLRLDKTETTKQISGHIEWD